MQHVVTHPSPPFRSRHGSLEVHQLTGWRDNFIWLLVAGDEAAVVDGPEADALLAYCQERKLRLTTVFNTHTHPDHIGVNRELAERGVLAQLRVVGSRTADREIPGLTEAVGEGDHVTFAGRRGRVMLTEGHLNGHISFVFDDVLFCGDTLFGGGCGYMFDGPAETFHASLRRLAQLPKDTVVCCAHEYTQDNLRFAWSLEPDNAALAERIRAVWPQRARGEATIPSSIDLERSTNPFLRTNSATIRASLARAFPERTLSDEVDVFAAARELKNQGAYKNVPDSTLPLE